ncbi:hypothetical protein LTR36_006725 [Oleoguttula mirabilis]|uniref:DUF300-domain-containing protein n=1 Tax=Oleoguttula mirabilis TaxID=1507867 RepID=A0AAV9JCH1_9PEZI|nr:hypothetical protein LTR36_006725 [Oleoguttula mirabilis]
MALTLLSAVFLIILHLKRYRAPKEQRQIIRICFAPFVLAIVSFAEIYDYRIAAYMDPIGAVYEAFCLCALYLLFIQFTIPSGTFGEDMFDAMQSAVEVPGKRDAQVNWMKTSWVMVFQYPITEIIAVVVLEATQAEGTYCVSSWNPRFGHLWYMIISTLGIVLAVTAIFKFHGRMKRLMKARRGMWKLLCFKGIVFLHFIQSWVFNILITHNLVKSSREFSYGDLTYGLPNVIMAVEMVLFSLSFWFAYSAAEYDSNARPKQHRLSFFQAMFDAMNPSDLFLGIVRIFTLLPTAFGSGRGGGRRRNGRESPLTGRTD